MISAKRCAILLITIVSALTLNISFVHSATYFYDDFSSWESVVWGTELFQTTSGNIALADEVGFFPGDNAKISNKLTFQSSNTGLSRGFSVETLQMAGTERVQFTFNDKEPKDMPEYVNALSVGDYNDWEDDDWQLNLLGGNTMTAFGVDLRDVYFEYGESITLYSGNDIVGTMDLGLIASNGDKSEYPNYFIGIVSETPFDRVYFNEFAGDDDIALADFRFANASAPPVVPEPVSSVLFVIGGASLGVRRFFKKRN